MSMRRLTVLLLTSLVASLGMMSTPAQAAVVHTASVCLDAAAAEPISVSPTDCSPTATEVLRVAVCVEPQGHAEGNQCDGFFTCSGIQDRGTSSSGHADRPSPDSILCIETATDGTRDEVITTLGPVRELLTYVGGEYIQPVIDLAVDAFDRATEPQLFVCSPYLMGCVGTPGDFESSPADCNEYIVQEDDLMICLVKPQP